MKEIIKGKTYNTQTAKLIGTYLNNGVFDRHYQFRDYYVKKTGELFVNYNGTIKVDNEYIKVIDMYKEDISKICSSDFCNNNPTYCYFMIEDEELFDSYNKNKLGIKKEKSTLNYYSKYDEERFRIMKNKLNSMCEK
jgi:hypothetical protein